MGLITRKNLNIIFGDRTLSCAPDLTQQPTGLAPLMNEEPFATIAKTLMTDRLIFAHQIHGTDEICIHSSADADRYMEHFYDADIIISTTPSVGIGVLTADCLPLILFDHENQILAAVHAGWRGTVHNIAGASIAMMVALGAKASAITAYFGPCAHIGKYEASPELLASLARSPYQAHVLEKRNEKIHFDMPRMNKLQLIEAGILASSIVLEYCLDTITNDAYWSYRRDAEASLRQPSIACFS